MNTHPTPAPTRLGTITIGQAPRPDITPILQSTLPATVQCVHVGVLDGLTAEEVARRYPVTPGQPMLVSRLLDGSSVRMGKAPVRETLAIKIRELEAQDCTAILILCTGEFHDLATAKAWLLEPDRLIPPTVAALMGSRQAGVIVPLQEQAASELGKFAALAHPPLCAAASPYAGDVEGLARAARSLREQGAQALILDCMGFVEAHRTVARAASGLPVILSNALVAKLTAELLA